MPFDPRTLIGLGRFPIDRLDSPHGARFLAACRAGIAATGVCILKRLHPAGGGRGAGTDRQSAQRLVACPLSP
jgi:hypothetical protein